jgi:hypothetical protein
MPADRLDDALQLDERVLGQLALGESQFREFKSAWEGPPGAKRPRDVKAVAKDIGETLVAFANADGGVLLIGVEDDAVVTGSIGRSNPIPDGRRDELAMPATVRANAQRQRVPPFARAARG